MLEIT